MKSRFATLIAVVAISALPLVVNAKGKLGPPGGLIYASDRTFKTIGTPADLPPHGPFDIIYALGNGLANVAEAAPGEPGFNGGRWEVRPVNWVTIAPTQFTNAGQVQAAAAAGQISIGEPIRHFECPLIPAN